MAYSPSAPASAAAAHHEPTSQHYSTAPAVEVASTEVLITEQEVFLGTAAAVRGRRKISRSERPSRPQRGTSVKRYDFLERALIAREMGRL
jgi:hypothetical protein